MEDFPPNSQSGKTRKKVSEKPQVEKVVSTDAVRRKKSLSKQFKATFFGGDAQSAVQYVLSNVVIPAVKDLMSEAASSGIERLIYGETRPGRRRGYGPPSGATGVVNYQRISGGGGGAKRSVSPEARARHDFDEIVLSSRQEAEDVIERMFDMVSQFNMATVADLYELTGIKASHTDMKWGWTDLRGAHPEKLRSGGFLLDLPDPEVLD